MNMPANTSTNPTFVVRLTHTDEEHAIEAVAKMIVEQQDPTITQTGFDKACFSPPTSRQLWEAEQFKGVVVTGNAKGYWRPADRYTFDVEVEHDPKVDTDFVRTRFGAYGHIAHDVTPHRWSMEGGC